MKNSIGKLFVIATPLGHRDDVTLRLLKTLEELNLYFVEDTREFRKLATMHSISLKEKKVLSMAAHNMESSVSQAINLLLKGESIGLLCDRGTPAISDPGALLVKEAHEKEIEVIPVPGPSSVSACVSAAGLSSNEFVFAGFFPRKTKERQDIVDKISVLNFPFVFFESPQRIENCLTFLKKKFPKGRVFIAREMTKTFEQYHWIELSGEISIEVKGEFTFILEPNCSQGKPTDWESEVALRTMSDKEWAKALSKKYAVESRTIYNALQKSKM